MQVSLRRTAAAAFTSLALASTIASAAAPAPVSSAPTSEKDRVSYAIGMQMAASLEQVKGDINPAVLVRAINTSLTGGKMAMTVPEAQATLKAFGDKMQARQGATQNAAGQKNQAEGAAFLAANGKKPGVKTTATGLQYQVLKMGTGPKPTKTDTVKVNYRGTLINGFEFDSSAKNGGPIQFQVGGVIAGWTEALQLMPVGSKFALWIPGNLGYGAKGTPGGPIGPNATLHFEVELLSVTK